MVAVDADHLAQRLFAVLFERLEICRIHGISAGVPVSLRPESALAPEAVFAPEDHAQPIACVSEGGVMRIMRAAHEVESRLLHEFHIALARRLRDRDPPAAVILMHVRAAQIKMLAIQEETAIGRPLEPSKAKRRLDF